MNQDNRYGRNINFAYTYVHDGGTCVLAGGRQAWGSLTITWSNVGHILAFSNATGLTAVGLAPTVVDGEVYLEGQDGGNLLLR